VALGALCAQDHSLINICIRMLHIHEGHAAGCMPVRTASIASMSKVLNVKRRRIYDIVNVLQGLRVTTRSEQGLYRWNGTEHVSIHQSLSSHPSCVGRMPVYSFFFLLTPAITQPLLPVVGGVG
jgi:hypothetical protein